jgi:hypothetical protein
MSKMPPRNVRDAGEIAFLELVKRNGGQPPDGLSACKWLARDMGVTLEPDGEGSGALLRFDRRDCPRIIYNQALLPREQAAGIFHELAELVLLSEHPLLTDYMYPVEYFYDGRLAPRDFRHRAAEWAEDLYRLWLRRQS